MDRRTFLSTVGLGGAAVVCAQCLSGCVPPDNPISPPTNIDFTLDLSASANAALTSVGGYLYKDGVIVANTPHGYVAVSQQCTHQGTTIYYDGTNNVFVCPAHGSVFSTSGAVLNGPASSPLGKYHTSLNGSSLRVYS